MAEIGKISIDFQVLKTDDPKVLLIADTSEWKSIEDSPSWIKITLPGGKKPCDKAFTKNSVNIFNSSILGITPKAYKQEDLKDLPDGIYTLELRGSPNSFNKTRYLLRTNRLQLRLDSLYASLGLTYSAENKEKRNVLHWADDMIKAAESAMRIGDVPKSSLYFKEAKNILDKYQKCEDCD